MCVYWQDPGFIMQVLDVCISCAASSNSNGCVLNGLKFIKVGF